MKLFARALVSSAVLVAVTAAPASAAELLSTKVASATTTSRICSDGLASGKSGVVSRRVSVGALSAVAARLTAASGDWDVAIFDARSRKLVAGSSGFGATEVASSFATAGTLIVQACRRSGAQRASLTVFAHAVPKTAPTTARLLKVQAPTQADRTRVANLGLDVTEHAGRDYVEVVAYGDKDLDLLRENGFEWKVRIADLAARSRQIAEANRSFAGRTRNSPLPSGRDDYRRLGDYEAEMKKLAEDNPGLVRPITLPNKTVEGREVQGIEIGSNVGAVDGRPVFAIMGAHHAREWPSSENTMEFAYELVNGARNGNAGIQKLLGQTRTVIVPVVNVDGFNVSREHLGSPAMPFNTATALADPVSEYRRRNCRFAPNAPTPPGACMLPQFRLMGTDPNRNYGALWGGPGASAAPLYDTYRGAGPFSEPETQNIKWLVSTRQVTTLITNHTFSNLILRAPGVRAQGVPVDEERMKALGDRMAEQNGYSSQPGWALYDTTGTTEDWSYNTTGGYGYTFEIGSNEFHPPFAEVITEYLGTGKYEGKGNRSAYLIALENTAKASEHAVLTGGVAPDRVLRLKKEFDTETSSVRPFETDLVSCGPTQPVTETETGVQTSKDTLETTLSSSNGRFEWHINPSTRPSIQEHREILTEDVGEAWEFNSGPDTPTEPGVGHADHRITITPEQAASAEYLAVSLDWDPGSGTTPEDYDLEIYRTNGSENEEDWEQAGSAGEAPGCAEYTELTEPPAGEYVLRVINFAAATQQYQLRAGMKRFAGYKPMPAKGGPESWKLTCETQDGKVLAERDIVIGRGESQEVGTFCGGKAVAGVNEKSKKKSARARCLTRANKVKGKAKRKRAVANCRKRYPAKKRSR